jgi:hypothetical protein
VLASCAVDVHEVAGQVDRVDLELAGVAAAHTEVAQPRNDGVAEHARAAAQPGASALTPEVPRMSGFMVLQVGRVVLKQVQLGPL